MHKPGKIGWLSAASIVVANMIGTGVFTTLGYQLQALSNTWTILLLWLSGGVMALCGAFTYAEVGTRLPRSGGEYHFLSRIYHPFVGYLSGWVSLTVGFASAIALAAMAIADYLAPLTNLPGKLVAALAIVGISIVHSFNIQQSSRFQNAATLAKLLLVIGLAVAAFCLPAPISNGLDWSSGWRLEVLSPAFAVSLVYIIYAFSGWNAAVYITDEIERPTRNLPKALLSATLLVSVLFVALQISFLRQASVGQLREKIEVGQIVAGIMFGEMGGHLVSLLIAALLIASISAMIWVGPRVLRAMAGEYYIWRFFRHDNRWGIPVRSIWLQTAISLFLVLSSQFEQVFLYSGFVLQVFMTLTVFGLFILRRRQSGKDQQVYKSPGYPWVQIVFLVYSVWVLTFLLIDKPLESFLGLLNLLAGALSYYWNYRRTRAGSEMTASAAEEPVVNKVDDHRDPKHRFQSIREK